MSEIKVLVSKNDIDAFIQTHQKCIIKFSAEWCAPCRRMADYYQVRESIQMKKILCSCTAKAKVESWKSISLAVMFDQGQQLFKIIVHLPQKKIENS